MKKINLITSKSSDYTGIGFYAENLCMDLFLMGFDSEIKEIPKYEINIRNRKIGGWKSQELFLKYYHASGINHSTSHWVITPKTNIITIHDLFPLTLKELNVPDSIKQLHLKKLGMINQNNIVIVPSNEINNRLYIKFHCFHRWKSLTLP